MFISSDSIRTLAVKIYDSMWFLILEKRGKNKEERRKNKEESLKH